MPRPSKKTRRERGEGSVSWNESKKMWQASLLIGFGANGRPKRKQVRRRIKADAVEALRELLTVVRRGEFVQTGRITTGQFFEQWLSDVIKPNLCVGTFVGYRSLIHNHVAPQIGPLRLSNVGPMQVQRLYAALDAKGCSARTREKIHIVLSGAFKQAVVWGLIRANPCKAVKCPKVERREMDVLDENEARTLLQAARDERLYAIYVLALTTGMRQGEMLGLQWRDLNIDGDRPSLVVMRTLDANAPRLVAKDTKTPWSRRTILLTPDCVNALKSQKHAMNAEGHRISPWVFCNSGGNPYYRGNLATQHFNPLLEKAGLRHIRFHDLRHTAATLMLSRGVNVKVVSQMLGHKDVLITLNTYGHILPSMQDQAVAAMNGIFGSQ